MMKSLEERKQDFINKAKEIHGDKYDYSEIEYISMRKAVKIKCSSCGQYFYQIPMVHLRGSECKCQYKLKMFQKQGLSLDEILNRFKKVHGDKYDYSEVEYKGTKKKVKIRCKNCNTIFWQIPEKHSKGSGCPNCSHMLSKEEFFKRAKEKHGDKYDYSEANIFSNEPLKILCKTCGKYFYQYKYNHLKKYGCPHCSKSRHLSAEEFFSKIKSIFGNIYDYSEAVYIDSRHKIKLYCKHCDIWFEKSTTGLLKGKGCPYCQKGQPDTYKIFVEKARKVHGNKYEYSEEFFSLKSQKIKIFCKKCKQWVNQTKGKHLFGQGCPHCNGKFRYTNEEFIKKSKDVFGQEAFDYSLCNYTGMLHKVELICNVCKEKFKALPLNHIHAKHGCPHCKTKSKGEDFIKKYFNDKNILFETQKTFKGCKDKSYLYFDFYLPDYNLCIEYQGEQHYKSKFFVRKSKSEEEAEQLLLEQQRRDQIKRDYCKSNNISLIEITYKDNLEKYLDLLYFKLKNNFVE